LNNRHISKSILFGVAAGDALGVPVEFQSRARILRNPVTDMRGDGTYGLPAGVWSDDSSMTFCLAEALIEGYDLNAIAQNFIKWYKHSYWTPRGEVFDIGIATTTAINRLVSGVSPDLAGGISEGDNGNGSLMRILPLILYIQDKPIRERFEITKQVSSITHGHILSVVACFYYLEFARHILLGVDKFEAYNSLKREISEFLQIISVPESEILLFDRLLRGDIFELPIEEIRSDGYVLHTLEASMWCILTTDNYRDAVLKAVNLGVDSDTTGAVCGGLAGLLYGFDSIPTEWVDALARRDDILDLAERLGEKFSVK